MAEEEKIVEANVVENEVKEEKKEEKKKKKVSRIILNTLTTIIVLLVGADAVIGVINMQKINDKEEPVWYLSTKKTETDVKTVTEYDLGLYRIVITDSAKETKTTLKPFFLKD